MTHARKPRRNKRFHPSIPRLPMTGALRDRIATHMHGAFAALRLSPSAEAFDALANIVNMVGLLDVPTLWAAEKVAVELMRAARATGA